MATKPLSAEEATLLRQLTVDDLRQLNDLRLDGKRSQAVFKLVNTVIDIEKNYAFALKEDPGFPAKHAYSRGKAAFGVTFLRLIQGAPGELGRREATQKQIKEKQKNG